MIFNSFSFLIFLTIFLFAYWNLNRKNRLYLIFISSLLFYSFWRIEFIFLILFSVLVDYYASIWIYSEISKLKRQIILLISLSINFSLLAFFKYYYFISDNVNYLLKIFDFNLSLPLLNIILPIGISFYTFQSVSYTIDVFRKKIKPEKEFILFCNYVIFFPQLVAGPILRAKEIIWQLSKKPLFKIENLYHGLKRIIFGLFLKVVIADNLAPIVDQSFLTDPISLSGIDVITISYLFGFQIYFDFSAYSHIAIGASLLMSIKFPENFNFPYHSLSPKEFWSRWHITLSSWVRDYLYLPLVRIKIFSISSKGFENSIYKNNVTYGYIFILLFTWSLMGFWHGPNWKFIIWGLMHALIIIFYRFFDKILKFKNNKFFNFISWIITLQLIMLNWIPFRANNFSDTFIIWSRLFDFNNWFQLSLKENTYIIIFLITFSYLNLPFFVKLYNRILLKRYSIKFIFEVLFLFFIVTLIIIFFKVIDQFIYFQF
jgi:D-alanyl-lipoteichoic acid acyltransferase DltB (MBOAT superfamily)